MDEKELLEKQFEILGKLLKISKDQPFISKIENIDKNNIKDLMNNIIPLATSIKNMDEHETKICSCCKLEKKINNFNRCKQSKDGIDTQCKKCVGKKRGIWIKNKIGRLNANKNIWEQFEQKFCVNKEINSTDILIWIKSILNVGDVMCREYMTVYLNLAKQNGYLVEKTRYSSPGFGSKNILKIYKKIPTETKTILYEQKNKSEIEISPGDIPLTPIPEPIDERSNDAVIKNNEKRKLFYRSKWL